MLDESLPYAEDRTVFAVFCLWSLVLLCRPQDYLQFLAVLRPGLVMTAIMLVALFLNLQKISGPEFLLEKQVKYYSALIGVMIAGLPLSIYVMHSFYAIFTEYIVAVIYFFLFYKLVDSLDKLSRLALVACLGSGAYLLAALLNFGEVAGRLTFGSMFDPNDLAYFALAFLPFNFLFIRPGYAAWIRLACLGSFCCGVLVILLSGSRGGLLSFVIAMLILLARTRIVNTSVKMLILAFGVVALAVAPVDYSRYATVFNLDNDYNVQAETGRFAIWSIGLKALAANPLTGVGVRNFPRAVGTERKERGGGIQRWQAAHNSFIQIGTETGFLGLILFGLLNWNVLGIFRRARSDAGDAAVRDFAEVGLVGFAGMFCASLFLSQAYSMYFVLYFAMSAALNQILSRGEVKNEPA